jgi:hypothetical protein
MSNGDDVARADLGKIAWNAWATDHPDQSVDFSGVEPKVSGLKDLVERYVTRIVVCDLAGAERI